MKKLLSIYSNPFCIGSALINDLVGHINNGTEFRLYKTKVLTKELLNTPGAHFEYGLITYVLTFGGKQDFETPTLVEFCEALITSKNITFRCNTSITPALLDWDVMYGDYAIPSEHIAVPSEHIQDITSYWTVAPYLELLNLFIYLECQDESLYKVETSIQSNELCVKIKNTHK